MKTLTSAALAILLIASSAGLALADDKATCFHAAGNGQTLRDAHKLVEAREQFRVCAAATCPPAVQTDCSGWVTDVDRAIPTVVLSAKDASGNDLFDVSVHVDGAPLAEKLDGVALPIDPGPHTFRFQWPDGTSTERQVLVPEGQKAMVVSATFTAPNAPPAPAPVAAPPPAAPAAARASESTHPSGLRTTGFVVGATGLLAIVVGSVVGGLTFAEVSTAKAACGPNGCAENTSPVAVSDMQTARTMGNTSTALFIAGGAFVAGGVALVWLGRSRENGAAIRFVPSLSARGATAGLGGVW